MPAYEANSDEPDVLKGKKFEKIYKISFDKYYVYVTI